MRRPGVILQGAARASEIGVSNQTAGRPRCIVIAGPNGAGKTPFAVEFLPREAGVIHFVNADLIAGGLSPLRPALAAQRVGRAEGP